MSASASRPSKGLGFTGIVSNIEYRGASVKLTVDGAGIEDFTAIVDDTDFFAKPVAVGDAVPLALGRRGRRSSSAASIHESTKHNKQGN